MSTPAQELETTNTALYEQLDAYPWSTDPEFQGGLRAILGPVQDPAQIAHLTLRAKCYYYARKAGVPVDFEGYRLWTEGTAHSRTLTQSSDELQHMANGTVTDHEMNQDINLEPSNSFANPGDGGLGEAPKPASFAEICDLIAEGKPIPGIKDIPDTILEGRQTESQAAKRKKPWERTEHAEDGGLQQASWIT